MGCISEEAKGGRGCSLSRRRHLLLLRSVLPSLPPSLAHPSIILASSTSSSFFPSPPLFHYFSILRFRRYTPLLSLILASPSFLSASLHSFRQGGTRRSRHATRRKPFTNPGRGRPNYVRFLLTSLVEERLFQYNKQGEKKRRGNSFHRLESTHRSRGGRGEEFLEGGEFPQILSSILFYDIKFARNQESEQKQSVFPGERSDFAPN